MGWICGALLRQLAVGIWVLFWRLRHAPVQSADASESEAAQLSQAAWYAHCHCCVIDGVFAVGEDGQLYFAEASALIPEDLAAVQQQVRARVLRWFARAGHLGQADARDMAGWHHGGGSSYGRCA